MAGDFSYAPGSKLPPMATAPPFEILQSDLRALFIRCFVDGHRDPHARPTAKEWQQTLDKAAEDLRVCSAAEQHIYGKHLEDSCPWCARVARGFKESFPSRQLQSEVSREPAQIKTQTAPTAPPASTSRIGRLGKFLFGLAIVLILIYLLSHK